MLVKLRKVCVDEVHFLPTSVRFFENLSSSKNKINKLVSALLINEKMLRK